MHLVFANNLLGKYKMLKISKVADVLGDLQEMESAGGDGLPDID